MDVDALLVGGNRFGWHRFENNGPFIETLLEAAGVVVDSTTDREALTDLAEYDVVVDYTTDSTLSAAQREGLLSFVAEGGGYAGVHCGADLTTLDPGPDAAENMVSRDDPFPERRELLGGHYVTHPDATAMDVNVVDSYHPITADIGDFTVWDEPYHVDYDDDLRVLARMDHPELGDMPVAWVTEYGEGDVFYCSLGHDRASLTNDGTQALVGAGVYWAGA
jgi:type 1 glutamine amidotransferase